MNENIVNRLRDQRDEDGYCVVCGDGKWKSYFPKCTLCDAADEIERLRSLITAWADACILMERTGSLDTTTPQGVAAYQALIALRKAVGR